MSISTEVEAIATNLSNAYDAIEDKGGTIPQNKNMVNLDSSIASIPSGGNNNLTDVLEGNTNQLFDNDATSLRNRAFYLNSNIAYITSFSFPNVTTIGSEAFYYQTSATFLNLDKMQTMNGSYHFAQMISLTEIKLPSLTSVLDQQQRMIGTFRYDANLIKVDLGNNSNSVLSSLHTYTFGNCSNLQYLILRWNNVLSVSGSINVFSNSGISSGTGFIYVPKNLINSYKSSSVWSTYANQIRAIEDYSIDGTVEGDITV